MKFLEIIREKKFALISVSLFIYLIFNLLEGVRGLISFYENKKLIKKLNQERNILSFKLDSVEKKINLLTEIADISKSDLSLIASTLLKFDRKLKLRKKLYKS